MIQLTKGGNAPLDQTDLTVTVDVAAAADLSALLVTEAGKVRTDADFVFYNQPQGPGVTCVPPAGGQPWQVRVDLTQVPADVHAVRLVTSLDDQGRVFGQVGQPVARVTGPQGPVAEFAMTGLDRETIVVALELYRRNGAWKVRAVGRGYDGGLADLITDHGVSVDETPAAPAAAAAPAAPAAPAAAPAPQAPLPPAYPAPVTQPPTAPVPQQAPAAPQPGFAAPQSGFGAPPPASPGEVSLTKGRPVSLAKGQKVQLTKNGGQGLTVIRMGLGWDPIKKGGFLKSKEVDIDLDASAVLFSRGQAVDIAFYNSLRSKDGSVHHQGDNRTGDGDGDDEVIVVDLTRVPAQVDNIVLIVTSYSGQTFEQVQNAFCRLVDQADGELARYTLAGGMPFTALAMARLYREGGLWKMQAIGEGLHAKVPSEALPQLGRYLV